MYLQALATRASIPFSTVIITCWLLKLCNSKTIPIIYLSNLRTSNTWQKKMKLSLVFNVNSIECMNGMYVLVKFRTKLMEGLKVKKLVAALLVLTLVVSPIGNFIFNDYTTAEAKGYKSGKKSFNTNNSDSKVNKSNIEKKKDDSSTTKSSTATNKKSGGLMKGLLVGGLAGLLFGSLFANMGMLGSILGFAINMLAIVFLIVIIRKVFTMLKKKKKDSEPWKN